MKQLALVIALFAIGAAIPIIGFWPEDAADPSRRGAGADQTPAAETGLGRLPDSPAGDLVRRSVELAGGWSVWADTRSVSYEKTTTPLAADGSPAGPGKVERHRYVLNPGLSMRIDWNEDGVEHSLLNDGQQAWYTIDGVVQTDPSRVDSAYNSTFGSHYVFGMPFKLTDPGATLPHVGTRELPDGTLADAVAVGYGEDVGSAGGLHQWTYFFDSETAGLRAYHLIHGPDEQDATWGEYYDYAAAGPWNMPTRRLGYGSNHAGERLAPREEIVYRDIRLDVELPAEIFRPESAGS